MGLAPSFFKPYTHNMAMRRTIFEIPAELKDAAIQMLQGYELLFSCGDIKDSGTLEIAITHYSGQNYLMEQVEQQINLLAERKLQAAS